MPTLSPVGPETRQRIINEGFNPDQFRYDEDLKQVVPYAPPVPSKAAGIGASFAQPIVELPAGAARGVGQIAGDLASTVPDWASGAALRSMGPSLLSAQGVSAVAQPIVDKLKSVPRLSSGAESIANLLGSVAGGIGTAAIPGVGLPALIGAYGGKRYGDIRAEGGNPLTAAVGGAIDAASVAVPPLKTAGMAIVPAAIKGGLLGGGVNVGQQLAQNVLADLTYKPGGDLTEGLGMAALTGAGLGAGASGVQARSQIKADTALNELKRVKAASQVEADQIAGRPPTIADVTMLNMGGADNLTGSAPPDPAAKFRTLTNNVRQPGRPYAEVMADVDTMQQLRPDISREQLEGLLHQQYQVDPVQWSADVRTDPARMGRYGDAATKKVAKLVEEGYPLTDADMMSIRAAGKNEVGPVVDTIKARHGAAAAEAARLRDIEAEKVKLQEAAAKEQAALEAKTQKALVGLVSDADAITALQQRAASQNIPLPETFTTPKELEVYIKGEERGLEAARKGREAAQKKQQEAEAKSRADLSAEQDAIAAIQQQAKTLGVELPTDYKTPKELQQWLNAYTKELQISQKGRPMVPEDTKSAAQSALVMAKEGVAGLDPVNAVKLAEQNVTDVPGATTPTTTVTANQPIKGKVRRQQIITPPEPAKAAPADSPIPDSPASIEAQFKATSDPSSTKTVTLLVPGTPLAKIPDGLDTVNTKHGIAVFNPKKITREQVVAAGSGDNFDGTVLGYSVAAKAPAETPTVAVTTKTEGTTEALSAAVPGTPEAVVKEATAQKAAVPEGTQSVRPVAEVIKDRVETNGAEPTPAQADALPKLPAEETINAEQIAKLNKVLETPAKPPVKGPDVPEIPPTKAGEPIAKKPAGRVIRKSSEKTGEPAPAGSTRAKPGGMGAGLKEKMDAKKSEVQEGGFVNIPGKKDIVDALDNVWKGARRVAGGHVQRLRTLPGGEDIARKINKMWDAKDDYAYSRQSLLKEAIDKQSPEDVKTVHDYRVEMYRDGVSGIQLTPKQQKINDRLSELVLDMRLTANKEGALVKDNGVYRQGEYNEFYTPQIFKEEIWKRIKANDPALRTELIDWLKSRGYTPEKASDIFTSLAHEKSLITAEGVDFGPIREPAGVDFPADWLKGPRDSMVTYINRWAADMAMSKHIEQDPVMATLRGRLEDSRGGTHTADPVYKDRVDLANEVRGALKSYAQAMAPNVTWMDKVNSVASSLTVQHVSGLRDVAHSLPGTWSQTDLTTAAEALVRVLTPGSFREGQRKGYIPSYHRANDAHNTLSNGEGLGNVATGLFDRYKESTGLHAMQDFTRLMGSFAGESAATKALAEKDAKFFARLDIDEPFTRPRDEVIKEAANRVQKNITSSYDGRDIPPELMTGSQSQAVRLVFGLARYAIGQTNRQLDYVGRSLKTDGVKGIKPLVIMALGGMATNEIVDFFVEQLTAKKPNDLTWAEWMRLDNPESIRFMANKLATANLGGYAMQLAATGANLASGVKTYMPKPQAFDLAQSIGKSFMNVVNKQNEEGLEWRDFLTAGNEFLRDVAQDYRAATNRQKEDTYQREERMYERIEKGNRKVGDVPTANPLSTNTRFNRAEKPEEIRDEAGRVLRRALEGGPVPAIRNSLREPEFYQWLDKLQPGSKSRALRQDMRKQLGVNQVKGMILEEARGLQKDAQKGKAEFDKEGQIKFR